jgi:hypothetical protein
MFTGRFTVHAQRAGGFRPDTFHDLLQRHITMPGLDPHYQHTLLDVHIAADGGSAELVVSSEPHPAVSLDPAFRVVSSTPAARVKVRTPQGEELMSGPVSAPLRTGQEVSIAGQHYRVLSHEWPHRNEHGVAKGDFDWQHVVVAPEPRPQSIPAAQT